MPAFLAPLFTKLGLTILKWVAIVGAVLAAVYSIRRAGVLAERADQINRIQKNTNVRIQVDDQVMRTPADVVHSELQRDWSRD